MFEATFNDNAHSGKLKLATYLHEKDHRTGPLKTAFNTLGMKFSSYRENQAARERLRGVLDLAYATKTGRALIESGASGNAAVAFEPRFPTRFAMMDGSVARISPKDPDDYLANLIVHELQHGEQARVIEAAFGDRSYFYKNARGLADTAYPALVKEADAFSVQAIQAYEMHLNGHPGPWAMHRFMRQYTPQADALAAHIACGDDPHAPETRQTMLEAWLCNSHVRASYDADFWSDIAQGAVHMPEDAVQGLTHANADLLRLVPALPATMDLTKPELLGVWARFTPEIDPMTLDDRLTQIAIFAGDFATAVEILDLAEDHYSGRNKLKDLPAGYNAQTLIVERKAADFVTSIVAMSGAHEVLENVSGAKNGLHKLVTEAARLAGIYPQLKAAFAPQQKIHKDRKPAV